MSDTARRRGGARRRPPVRRRATGMGSALGVTLLSAVAPGSGFWWAGRKALGGITMAGAVVTLVCAALYLPHDLRGALDFAFDPGRLEVSSILLAVLLVLWTLVVVLTFLMVRPLGLRRWVTGLGSVMVAALILGVAVPTAMASRYARIQADFVHSVFDNNGSATAPRHVSRPTRGAGATV